MKNTIVLPIVPQNRIEYSFQSLSINSQIDRLDRAVKSDRGKLKRLRKRKRLTDCLEILGEKGIHGDLAIFILSSLGGEG
jgi:hypothetical protein